MVDCCNQLGAKITTTPEGHYDIQGFGNAKPADTIWLGNSGTALRLSIALATVIPGTRIIDGDQSLQKRPNKALITALKKLGANVRGTSFSHPDSDNNNNNSSSNASTPNNDQQQEYYAPITVTGGKLSGKNIEISGTKSSQYISALLLVAPFADSETIIKITGNIVSQPYIEMTKRVLASFGIQVNVTDNNSTYHIPAGQKYQSPNTYTIPPDYSQAAFFLAAACLVPSNITIQGLIPNNAQADEQIIQILTDMGATIKRQDNNLTVCGPFDLMGIEVDLHDAPDLFPVLSVLGIYAKGSMRLYNMPQIRYKETDRISVISREFKKYRIQVNDDAPDEMTIHHQNLPDQQYDFTAKGTTHGVTDHRIAMALSLIGIRSGNSIIRDAQSVSISYPNYFKHLESIGIKTTLIQNN